MGRSDARPIEISGDWLSSPATQALFDAYDAAGSPLYAVGGCVRNTLLNLPVSDIDMASPVPPDTATAFLNAAGFKVIPTGINHGTLTVMSGGVAYEITTFRQDVKTDGRRAVVAFNSSLAEDAARRDFTINALYAARDGAVIDPVGGLDDIHPTRVRFIGRAEDRIREDYLRSLRFFRFHAHYGDPAEGFDADALSAIASTQDGIDGLSKERVTSELLKLLAAESPPFAINGLQQTGLLMRLLPGADAKALGPLVHFEDLFGLAPDPVRRLASLGSVDLIPHLRLSKAQARQFENLRSISESAACAGELGYRLGRDGGLGALILRAALLEAPVTDADQAVVARGAEAEFPLKAKDLADRFSGPALGAALREREAAWIASEFTLSKAALLG